MQTTSQKKTMYACQTCFPTRLFLDGVVQVGVGSKTVELICDVCGCPANSLTQIFPPPAIKGQWSFKPLPICAACGRDDRQEYVGFGFLEEVICNDCIHETIANKGKQNE